MKPLPLGPDGAAVFFCHRTGQSLLLGGKDLFLKDSIDISAQFLKINKPDLSSSAFSVMRSGKALTEAPPTHGGGATG